METGIVEFFNNSPNKLFGFIKTADGKRVFFHFNNGSEDNTRMPQKGDRLKFEGESSMRGPKAALWAFEDQEISVTAPTWSGETPKLNETLRANLDKFGLEDIMVTGTIGVVRRDHNYNHAMTTVQLGPMHLSQMCGNIWSTIQKRRSDEADLHVEVFHNGERIGSVDSDHSFHYSAAPDLRTALGWVVATDLGHVKVLHGFHLDGEVKQIEAVIRNAPTSGDEKAVLKFYLGAFKNQLARTIKHERTSRFGDGYMGPLYLLWAVGTKAIHGHVLSYGNVMIAY
ncbi:MAG TPA: cold shock domain-containing protein [Candidatus Paceibacterota bacterium]